MLKLLEIYFKKKFVIRQLTILGLLIIYTKILSCQEIPGNISESEEDQFNRTNIYKPKNFTNVNKSQEANTFNQSNYLSQNIIIPEKNSQTKQTKNITDFNLNGSLSENFINETNTHIKEKKYFPSNITLPDANKIKEDILNKLNQSRFSNETFNNINSNVSKGEQNFSIHSADFEDGDYLDNKIRLFGQDFSPSLNWVNFPKNTQSFALSFESVDKKHKTYNWLLINIPRQINSFIQNTYSGQQIKNSFGLERFKAPELDSNKEEKYIFKIYALKVKNINPTDDKSFIEAVNSNKISETELSCYLRGPKQ